MICFVGMVIVANITFFRLVEDNFNLMNQLFQFMKEKKDEIHPLILSSIFHYEFVFIHPFKDGNGRTARLWHNVILSKWKEIFEYLPLESQLKKYQEGYYKAIADCDKQGDSTVFIEFMLKMIDEVLDDTINSSRIAVTETKININKLLDIMEYNKPMTANEIMEKLGIKSKETLRNAANWLLKKIKNTIIKSKFTPYDKKV